MEVLKNADIDRSYKKLITNLYWKQTANIKFENQMFEDIQIMKGVRLFFNIHSEAVFQVALDGARGGVVVNDWYINNTVWYDDNNVLLANSKK